MTSTEATKLAAMLATEYDVPAWQPEKIRLMAANLTDLPFEPAAKAVQAWIATSRDRPHVSDIRAAVRQCLESGAAVPAELEPDQAWDFVLEQFTRTGRYRLFPDRHPLVAAAVKALGWETLCASENPEADRAHFWRVYSALLTRARQQRHAARGLTLPGDAARLAPPPQATRPPIDAPHVPMRMPAPAPVLEPAHDGDPR